MKLGLVKVQQWVELLMKLECELMDGVKI